MSRIKDYTLILNFIKLTLSAIHVQRRYHRNSDHLLRLGIYNLYRSQEPKNHRAYSQEEVALCP